VIYIGIDPGSSGAIAVLDERVTSTPLGIMTFPLKDKNERELLDFLEAWRVVNTTYAVLEHVWSTPGQGGAFAFGRNVGWLQMALTSTRVPFDLVLPRAWQKALDVRYPQGATDTEKKNITKRRATQLFPSITITHAIADALLIAEHCRRQHRGRYGEAENRRAQGHTEARPQRQRKSERTTHAIPRTEGHAAAGHGRHAPSAARADGVSRRRDSTRRSRGA
jgi:Holliday junction resolvasome RuvABC endonuclease subunit